MPIKKILFLLFLTAPACAWADLDCGIDERPIIQTITVNEQASTDYDTSANTTTATE